MRTTIFGARMVSSLALLGLLAVVFADHGDIAGRSTQTSADPEDLVGYEGAFDSAAVVTNDKCKPRNQIDVLE